MLNFFPKEKFCLRMFAGVTVCLSLIGCGTVQSTAMGDDYAVRELRRVDTRCDSLPHLYGGVAFNVCRLNTDYHSQPQTHSSFSKLASVRADTVLCVVADTIVLPYTGIRQVLDGSRTL